MGNKGHDDLYSVWQRESLKRARTRLLNGQQREKSQTPPAYLFFRPERNIPPASSFLLLLAMIPQTNGNSSNVIYESAAVEHQLHADRNEMVAPGNDDRVRSSSWKLIKQKIFPECWWYTREAPLVWNILLSMATFRYFTKSPPLFLLYLHARVAAELLCAIVGQSRTVSWSHAFPSTISDGRRTPIWSCYQQRPNYRRQRSRSARAA